MFCIYNMEKKIVKLGIFLFGIGNGAKFRPQNWVIESPDCAPNHMLAHYDDTLSQATGKTPIILFLQNYQVYNVILYQLIPRFEAVALMSYEISC